MNKFVYSFDNCYDWFLSMSFVS